MLKNNIGKYIKTICDNQRPDNYRDCGQKFEL